MQKPPESSPSFKPLRSVKIGTFHIGSSMADLLSSAVWNRIMIVDLGVVAWPVAMLSALRYLMAPLSLWVGHRSDTHPIFGSRRLAYIWIGRLLMLLSLPLLPVSTVILSRDTSSSLGWGLALLSFILYGFGTLISGSPYLALVHDSAPYERRSQVIGIVQFILVVSFAFIPAIYALLMPVYDPRLYLRLIIFAMIGATFFWFFSVWGEERVTSQPQERPESQAPLKEVFFSILQDSRTRRYAVFLGGSAFFAFMQDAVLEPFGGDVFGLEAGETTRFNAYWGVGVLVAMLITIYLTRKRRPEEQVNVAALGLAVMCLPMLGLAYASWHHSLAFVMPILIAFGLGFGVFTVGGVSLLMAMNEEKLAATYLALWTVIQLISRGAGIAAGGILRDLVLNITGSLSQAYAGVFMIEALGLFLCIYLLKRVDILGFVKDHTISPKGIEALVAATD